MADHYFTAAPESAHAMRSFSVSYAGRKLVFHTDAGVFSKQHVDPGSLLLCDALPENLSGDVLDVGCGWGAMTVLTLAAHPKVRMTMSDVNERALALAEENVAENGMRASAILSDGFSGIGGVYDAVITNPPIRAGKEVVYGIFKNAAAHLRPGGALYAVVRRKQGAESALRFLEGIYREAEVIRKDGGYWVLRGRTEADSQGI